MPAIKTSVWVQKYYGPSLDPQTLDVLLHSFQKQNSNNNALSYVIPI